MTRPAGSACRRGTQHAGPRPRSDRSGHCERTAIEPRHDVVDPGARTAVTNQPSNRASFDWTFALAAVEILAAGQLHSPTHKTSGIPTWSYEPCKSHVVARSQAGAPSWTSEGADTLFVCERVRKAAALPGSASGASNGQRSERRRSFLRERRRRRRTAPAPPICRRI